MAFDHERLDVYRLAVDFVGKGHDLVERLPRGRGYVADQLQRASLSIVLNIAEGAGKFHSADKASFYARARGSTTECAAVLDVCIRLGLLDDPLCAEAKGMLERISRMLTKLVRACT
jgi:four helix bundle protein